MTGPNLFNQSVGDIIDVFSVNDGRVSVIAFAKRAGIIGGEDERDKQQIWSSYRYLSAKGFPFTAMAVHDVLHGKVVQDVIEWFYGSQFDFDQAIILDLFYVNEEVFQTAIKVREQSTHIAGKVRILIRVKKDNTNKL